MSRETFYAAIRPTLGGVVTTKAKESIGAAIDEWDSREDFTDLRWLAYMLATMLGETGQNMSPVREGFTKTDIQARAFVRSRGYRYAAEVNGNVYYGRGNVQLTWDFNYKNMGAILGIDLYNNPDLALQPDVAVKIMFEGMKRGTFTGKKLAHYFNEKVEDFDNARRIINGTDRMVEIGNYGRAFHRALLQHLPELGHKAAKKPPMETTPKQEAVAITTPATGGVVAEGVARQVESAPKVDVGPDQVSETLEGLQTTIQPYVATGLRIFAVICGIIMLIIAAYTIWKYAKVIWSWWRPAV